MKYIGDFAADATVNIFFTTNDGSGGAVAPSSAFEAADVKVYKGVSATQRSSEVGYTMVSPFDSITGLHTLALDTSDNTDAGFWAAGNDYTVVLSPDETVDGQTVVRVLGQFSIENRFDHDLATVVNAQVSDVMKTDTIAQLPQQAPPGTPTFEEAIMYVYQYLRNYREQDATTIRMYADDGTTIIAKATISDDATDFVKAEFVTGP